MAGLDHRNDSFIDSDSLSVPVCDNVSSDERAAGDALVDVWRSHLESNRLRLTYFNAHERLKNLGVSVPDRIASKARPVVGWPEKSVRALADLSVFEGFSVPDGDPDGVGALAERNDLLALVPQTIVSAYTQSCAFWTVSRRQDGTIAIAPHAAGWSSAIWDYASKRIGSALTIDSKDKDGRVTQFTVWLPGETITYTRNAFKWAAVKQDTGFDFPPVAAFAYDAQLDRPFGRSRITRPLMHLTDIAYRTIVRMETTAEFYAAPRLWFVGLSDEMFNSLRDETKGQKWNSLISAINGLTADTNGGSPTMHQVEQASMTPHADMLKTIAQMAAAETDLPATDMGITLSNPTSAESMAEAERKLSRTADRQNRAFGDALKQVMTYAVCMGKGTDERAAAVGRMNDVHALWAPTKEESDAAKADYYTKVAGANAAFADSDVGLRKLGLTEDEIKSLRVDEQSQRAQSIIDALRIQSQTPQKSQQGNGVNNGGNTAPQPAQQG